MLTRMDFAPARSIALPRSRTLLVAGALLVAFAVRVALAWLHATPNYFPDEYLYAALGRSFGSFDGATIRGGAAHFPALLEPLLAAPVWHIGSVETAYRLVQVVHAAAFTLAAIPAYAIARRIGVGNKAAFAVAAGALLIPDAVYAGFVVAEPIAYPLALGAIATGIAALERPRLRTQWLFLACAALATFARLQLAVLPLCFALAVVAIGLREHDLRRLARAQRLPLAAAALAVLGALAGVALRGLGYYSGASNLHFDVVSVGKNLTVLFYGAGWAIVPGAAVGIVLCIARPRSRAEAAFGWLAASLGAALLLEAAIWGDSSLVQERYLFYVLPLAGAAFCLQAARGWPLARVQAVLAAGLLLLSVRVPLSGWAQPGTDDHSAFLLSVERLQLWFGTSTGDLVVAAAAALLSVGAALGPWRRRVAAPLLLGAALAASTASLGGVTALDHANSLRLLHRYLPAERSWVDAEHVGGATLLEAAGNRPSDGEEQLFWNRSLRRVAVLPGGSPPDRLAAAYLSVDAHGVLRDHGRACAARSSSTATRARSTSALLGSSHARRATGSSCPPASRACGSMSSAARPTACWQARAARSSFGPTARGCSSFASAAATSTSATGRSRAAACYGYPCAVPVASRSGSRRPSTGSSTAALPAGACRCRGSCPVAAALSRFRRGSARSPRCGPPGRRMRLCASPTRGRWGR